MNVVLNLKRSVLNGKCSLKMIFYGFFVRCFLTAVHAIFLIKQVEKHLGKVYIHLFQVHKFQCDYQTVLNHSKLNEPFAVNDGSILHYSVYKCVL